MNHINFCSHELTNQLTGHLQRRPLSALKVIILGLSWHHCLEYRYPPHNDISVNDGPHIRQWSHKIIIPLCYNCLQYSDS